MRTPLKLTLALLSLALLAILALGVGLPLQADVVEGENGGSDKPNVIILGFDGMDYELTAKMIEAGRLPSFKKLADSGGLLPSALPSHLRARLPGRTSFPGPMPEATGFLISSTATRKP